MVISGIALCVVVALVLSMTNPVNSTQVKIVVKCSGSWTGMYGETGNMDAWSGTGDKTVVYTRSSTSASVMANVFVLGTDTVTIQIVSMGGQVLKESTATAYAQVVWLT